MEGKNPNLELLTITRCPDLDIWEKEWNTELIRSCYEELKPPSFEEAAKPFHPDMKVIPLKLPQAEP